MGTQPSSRERASATSWFVKYWSALPSGVAGGSYFLRTRHQFASEAETGLLRSCRTASFASGSRRMRGEGGDPQLRSEELQRRVGEAVRGIFNDARHVIITVQAVMPTS